MFEGIHLRERIPARNRDGATAIEYTLTAVAAIVAIGAVGTKVNAVLGNVASVVK